MSSQYCWASQAVVFSVLMKSMYLSQTECCPIQAWLHQTGCSQQQMINTMNNLLTIKWRLPLCEHTTQTKRTCPHLSSCFSHTKGTTQVARMRTRRHWSHTYRHQGGKKKEHWHVYKLKLKIHLNGSTTTKVQREHKQQLVKQVQTSAQYLRGDECITFFLFTALALHQSD